MSVNTVQQLQSQVEVWRNTMAGPRWYIVFDLQGRETTKLVDGYKTFTLSTFERQLNQSRAANSVLDLFRNGTFILEKESSQTDRDEVASPNALTDFEIEEFARHLMYGKDQKPSEQLWQIDSTVTLERIHEQLVLNEAPKSLITLVKTRQAELTPNAPRVVRPQVVR